MGEAKLSQLAETLIGSEIVKLGGEIKEKIKAGEKIYNFTVGDFDPQIFPIPQVLEAEIINAYKNKFTNYPAAEGNLDLREAISSFLKIEQGLHYSPAEILVASGGRPLIYSLFRAIIDKGDKVIYGVPSWNNNHYSHFVEASHIVIEATYENNFMLSAKDLKPHIKGATLISLCSPQNPTGTTFSKDELTAICNLVIEENNNRKPGEKKLYVMYDQMYWCLTYGKIEHYNPVSLCPEMKHYTIFIDAISKVFAATGVRVGWAMGPQKVINKMKSILTHLGAWAPMAEQKAVAKFLLQTEEINKYLEHFKNEIEERLVALYTGIQKLKNEGFAINAIAPQAAIYLTVQFDLVNKKTKDGLVLNTQSDVTAYLLNKAGLAIVPFSAFGAHHSNWYRLSIGTCKKEEIGEMFSKLKRALGELV
ncbi:MAG: pyridoxal phosphate-dependent aminotransferase [Bacteroidia bacterium]